MNLQIKNTIRSKDWLFGSYLVSESKQLIIFYLEESSEFPKNLRHNCEQMRY